MIIEGTGGGGCGCRVLLGDRLTVDVDALRDIVVGGRNPGNRSRVISALASRPLSSFGPCSYLRTISPTPLVFYFLLLPSDHHHLSDAMEEAMVPSLSAVGIGSRFVSQDDVDTAKVPG